MKKVISMLSAMALFCAVAFAQPQGNNPQNKGDWREKVRAAQVAFITQELDLTEAEAQSFWPVYNDVQKQRREAYATMQKAYMELLNGADGEDAAKLLNAYLDAKKASEAVESASVDRYKKVLPVQKVAKLLLAEEKFRHQQIGRLGQGGMPGGMPPQGAPGRGRNGGMPGGENAPTQPEA